MDVRRNLTPSPTGDKRGLALLLVVGCATVPAGPSVSVLPGRGKTFAQFQDDDVACRQWARQEVGTTPGASAVRGRPSSLPP